MKNIIKNWKLLIGLLLSLVFMYLAFSKVDFGKMIESFKSANYWYIIPGIAILFLSHWLRTLRWQYLLRPIHFVPMSTLFSSLMIGYMANIFLPAHLGEFLRAYIVGKKKPVAASAVFGTIVIERLIDVFTMVILLALTMIIFPFPTWVQKSGYFSFIGIIILFIILIAMKRYRTQSLRLVGIMTKPLPEKISHKIDHLLHSFLDGIVPLKAKKDYLIIAILSVVIWACYAYIFQLVFYSFDFVDKYNLPWSAALVLLVITTISVLVPSSPGYVGTYHYLCQLSLGLFGVPGSPALTFAFVMHGVNFIPVLIVGLFFASAEGMSLKQMQSKAAEERESLE